jgi:hypothetical protein
MFARLPSGRRGRRDARCPSKRESSSKRPRTAWRALRRCGRGVDGMPWFKARSMPIRTCMLGPRSARARCRGNAGSWPSAEARAHGFLPSRIVMLSYGDGECLSLPGDGSALVKRTANVIPSAARASARRANHAPQSPTGRDSAVQSSREKYPVSVFQKYVVDSRHPASATEQLC